VNKKVNKSLPRQVYILLTLYAGNKEPIHDQLRLEKLLFLVQKEVIEGKGLNLSIEDYNFRAYKYGPFTEEVYDDVWRLKELGLVNIEERGDTKIFSLTEVGVKLVENILRENENAQKVLRAIEEIKKRWNKKDIKELLKYVYRNYPEYTEKSLIKHILE